MQNLPKRRTILRWAFLAFGMFWIIRPDAWINAVFSWRPLAAFLFANNPRNRDLALIPVFFIFGQSGILSLITA